MMEWHPVFRVGRSRVQVSFTGGHLCGGGVTPASFETSDPVVQKVIEDSAAFRSGRIKVIAGCERRGSTRNPPEVSMEFDDLDKAADFLQHKKGIPLDRVITLDQCVAEAKLIGIELKIRN